MATIGRTISAETKEKIAKTLLGRKHSEQRCRAIKLALNSVPKELRLQRNKNASITLGGHAFELVDLTSGEVIYEGFLRSEAASKFRLSKEHLKQVLKGVRNTIKGRYFARYIDYIDTCKAERINKLKKKQLAYSRKYVEILQNKVKRDLRCRLTASVKRRGLYKSGSSIENLGCSVLELIAYLESKFQEGMTWQNHSLQGWHIDHILPLGSFNLSNLEQLKKACHYSNLQPLWALDNLKKGDKL